MKRAGLVAVVFLAVLGVGLLAQQRTRPEPTANLIDDYPRDAQPGEKASLEEAHERAPFDFATPDHALAADSIVRQAWIFTGQVEESEVRVLGVRVDYDTGITVTIRPAEAEEEKDAASYYERLAKESGDGFSVDSVDGIPALLIEPNTDDLGSNPAALMIAIDGIRVEIRAEYEPGKDSAGTDDLKEIATSAAKRWGAEAN